MRRCPSCGEENAEQARFCSACGTRLAEATPARAEERKVVSVLFADLVGFTARSDRADPEDVRATLSLYHERLKREIERFGGTVEKFVGDAVMAAFGAPVAHEDDAERAVRSALRILEAIDELNAERPGLDLVVRAAVNTGEAVVALGARPALGEGFVTGDVVNVASRLQGVAPVGGVVVGELTFRATRSAIEYEELEPVAVKGKDEPIPIWRAISARGRFGVDVGTGTTPLIGRDHELALLEDLLRRVVREQGPQLVTLSGEPGVGKSRLTREFFRFVDGLPELVFWRQGRCLPYGEGITFWALGEIVKSHAGIAENDPPDVAAAKLAGCLADVVEDDAERDWIRSRLAPLVGLGDESAAEREESFAAWRSFLEAVATMNPFVMIVEDLHWADPAMLAFMEHLADWASGVPLFVLCTARPELYEREPGWGGGKRNHTAVSLSPLSTEETARLIDVLLERAVLPAETQATLLSRAGGNPLYAEEFIRMLVDRGVLVRRGATWDLTAGEEEIPVPESVQALIAARLDTLPADRKALLQDAAVVGKVFWAGAVAEMGGFDPHEVQEPLHELARKELLRPARRSSVEGEVEYAFWHMLIRDVAYGQIPRAARAAKHRVAATWIERIAGDRVADSAELLAYHYEQALELARAAGSDEDGAWLAERATEFLVMSGDRAFHLDPGKAEALYRRALELIPAGRPERGRVLLQVARTESERNLLAEAEQDFGEAIAELESAGDVVGTGEAHARLARTLWRRGETARARGEAEKAVRLLSGEPPGPELVNAHNEVGALAMLASLPQEAIDSADRAIEISEGLSLQPPIVRALETRGVSRVELGQLEDGLDDLRRALDMGLDLGLGYETATAYANLATMLEWIEGPQAALTLVREGIEFARRRGLAFMMAWLTEGQAVELFCLGRWDESLAVTDEVLEWGRIHEAGQIGYQAALEKAVVLVHRGRVEEAGALVEELLPKAREVGDPQTLVPSLYVGCLVERARGDRAAALGLVREIADVTAERPTYRMVQLGGVFRILISLGDPDEAEAFARGLSPRTARERNGLLSAGAILDEARGRLEEALSSYREAADAWSRFGDEVEHAYALLGAGRCLLALGRQGEALGSLRRAHEWFTAFGAVPLVAEADDLLARSSAKTSETSG